MTADITFRPGRDGRPFEAMLDGVPVTLSRTVRPGGGFITGERLYLHPTDWWALLYPGDYAAQLRAVRRSVDADVFLRLHAAGLL